LITIRKKNFREKKGYFCTISVTIRIGEENFIFKWTEGNPFRHHDVTMSQLFFEPRGQPLSHLRRIAIAKRRGHEQAEAGQGASLVTIISANKGRKIVKDNFSTFSTGNTFKL
jgi:hypothetical protein